MDWTNIQLLTFVSREKILKFYEKCKIPTSFRATLSIPIQLEIVLRTTEESNHEQLLLNATNFENYLLSVGLAEEWNKVKQKYENERIQPFRALQRALLLERQMVQTEVQIEQSLILADQMMAAFQPAILEFTGSGDTLHLINSNIVNSARGIFNTLNANSQAIMDLIMDWKHSKRYEPKLEWTNCSKIEGWIDRIFTQAWNLGYYTKQLKRHYDAFTVNIHQTNIIFREFAGTVNNLVQDAIFLVSRLLNATCLLSMDSTSRFVKYPSTVSLKLRHLLGGLLIQMNMISRASLVKLSLINRNDVNHLLANSLKHSVGATIGSVPTGARVLENNNGNIGLHLATNENGFAQFVVNFENCGVKKPNRAASTTTGETVMDEKFCFLAEFLVQLYPDLKITVWTLSSPVVVATSGSQQGIRSLVTIFWDNALCKSDRTDLDVPKTCSSSEIVEALDEWQKIVTKIPLMEESKRFLKLKLLDGANNVDQVNFEKFCSTNMSGTNFTFWEWFLKGIKLAEDNFLDILTDGYVMMFMGGAIEEEILFGCEPGTLIIRMSETYLGIVTISWLHKFLTKTGAEKLEVIHVGLKSDKDNKSLLGSTYKNIQEAILDLSRKYGILRCIYPDQDLGIFMARHTPIEERDVPPTNRRGYARVIHQIQLFFGWSNPGQ